MTETTLTQSSFSKIQIGRQNHVDKSNAQQYECMKKLQNLLLNCSIGYFSMDYARSCKICYLIIRSGYLPISLYMTKYMYPESLILYSNKYFCKHYIIALQEKEKVLIFWAFFFFAQSAFLWILFVELHKEDEIFY